MKTKKALGGLFGLLGSFGSFPLAGFFPPLVAGAPFLFTASLTSKSKTTKSTCIALNYSTGIHITILFLGYQILDLEKYQTLI